MFKSSDTVVGGEYDDDDDGSNSRATCDTDHNGY
jgi:hypothetical protein